MKYRCEVTVDVHAKYGTHVARLFEDFVNGLPARIGGLTIEDSQHGEQVPPKDASRKGAKPRKPAGHGEDVDGSDA